MDRPPLGARPPEAVVQAGVSPRLRSVGRARRPVATPAMAKVPVILEGAAIGAERAPGREEPASDVRARLAPGPEGSLRGARPLHPREVPVDEPPVRVHERKLTGRVATSSGTASSRPASFRRERAGKHPRQPTHRRVVGKRIRGDELPDLCPAVARPMFAPRGSRAGTLAARDRPGQSPARCHRRPRGRRSKPAAVICSTASMFTSCLVTPNT